MADGLPSIHYGEMYTHYGISATEALSHVDPSLAASLRFASRGDVIFAAVGETVEDVGKAVAWLGEREAAVHDDCFIFRSDLDPKFVAHFTRSDAFNLPKQSLVARAKVKRLSGASLARLRIPVPPIEVQREIVLILDRLTEMGAGLATALEAELDARSRQNAYFRDQVLVAFRDAPLVPLGEIIREPLANGRSARDGEGYPVLRLTALRSQAVDLSQYKHGHWTDEEGRRFRVEAGDIFVSRGNGSIELIGRASIAERTAEVAFPDTMIRIRPDLSRISLRYFLHAWAAPAARASIQQKAKAGTGVWKVSQDDLAKVRLPVPPIKDQERIAQILDTFDAATRGLAVSVRAEIQARRQQLDFYRNRLFTFQERAA